MISHNQSSPAIPRCVILANPNAGSAVETEIASLAQHLGHCEVRNSQSSVDLTAIAQEAIASGIERIIVAGGDGTINHVINALSSHLSSVEFALLPVGTGNDLARSLGIPLELHDAVELIRSGAPAVPIDLIRTSFSKHPLLANASAAGFSDAVNARVNPASKSRWGPLAYIFSAAAALPDLTPYQVSLMIDGHRYNIEAFNIVIANGRTIAGGIPIAPTALLDDGKLDVIIVPAHSIANAALAVPEILFGRHVESDRVMTTQAQRVVIESDPPIQFNADGEPSDASPATLEVMRAALRIVAAPDAPALSGSALAAQGILKI